MVDKKLKFSSILPLALVSLVSGDRIIPAAAAAAAAASAANFALPLPRPVFVGVVVVDVLGVVVVAAVAASGVLTRFGLFGDKFRA